jgi:hypothetical protein
VAHLHATDAAPRTAFVPPWTAADLEEGLAHGSDRLGVAQGDDVQQVGEDAQAR